MIEEVDSADGNCLIIIEKDDEINTVVIVLRSQCIIMIIKL